MMPKCATKSPAKETPFARVMAAQPVGSESMTTVNPSYTIAIESKTTAADLTSAQSSSRLAVVNASHTTVDASLTPVSDLTRFVSLAAGSARSPLRKPLKTDHRTKTERKGEGGPPDESGNKSHATSSES